MSEAATSEESTAGAGARGRDGRTRMCAVSRSVRPEAELIRFVAAPDNSVVADIRAKLPGRGVWVEASRARIAEAVKRKAFARSLKAEATADPDLPEKVAGLLREAALGRLGLARKAGEVALGFAKVEAAISGGQLQALVIASDAAEDGERKMMQVLRRRFGDAPPIPLIRLFGSEELGLALGRANVIHAAVLQGAAGKSFVGAAIRLRRYDGAADGDPGTTSDRADDPQGERNG